MEGCDWLHLTLKDTAGRIGRRQTRVNWPIRTMLTILTKVNLCNFQPVELVDLLFSALSLVLIISYSYRLGGGVSGPGRGGLEHHRSARQFLHWTPVQMTLDYITDIVS